MGKENDNAIERLSQVYSMNLNVPLCDRGIRKILFYIVSNISNLERKIDDTFIKIESIPVNDIINITLECHSSLEKEEENIITSMLSVFDTFKNLKYIDLTFFKDGSEKCQEIYNAYNSVVDEKFNGNKSELFDKIYDITELEMNLGSHFKKDAIDFINKTFIFYDYMSNEYLKRRFVVEFEFDEYINFMNMVLRGNEEVIKQFGVDIAEYFLLFPNCIFDKKPKIRIVTNFSNL